MGREGESLQVCLMLEGVNGENVEAPFQVFLRTDGGKTSLRTVHFLLILVFLSMLLIVESADISSGAVISFDLPLNISNTRCGSINISMDSILEGREEFTLYVAEVQPIGEVEDFPVRPPDKNATIIVAPDPSTYPRL